MKFLVLVFILLLILAIISFPIFICSLEIIWQILWVQKFSKLVSNSHFIIKYFYLYNILLLAVQTMKVNNNTIFCESITDYRADERKEEILSLFYMTQCKLWVNRFQFIKKTFQQSEYRKQNEIVSQQIFVTKFSFKLEICQPMFLTLARVSKKLFGNKACSDLVRHPC